MITPKEIIRLSANSESGLRIVWSNDSESFVSSESLRKNCPCAECKEKRGELNHSQPLISKKRGLKIVENDLATSLSLDKIWSIGNYAIGLAWADGHSSGVYTFALLQELAKK